MIKNEYAVLDNDLLMINHFFSSLRQEMNPKLSLREVSKYTGICASEICRLEKNERDFNSLSILLKLSSFYNLSNEQFVSFYHLLSRKDSNLFPHQKIFPKRKKIEIKKESLKKLRDFFVKRRTEEKLSLNSVEKFIGLTAGEILRIETGYRKEISLRSLIALSKFYDVSDSQIIDFYMNAIDEVNVNSLANSKEKKLGK